VICFGGENVSGPLSFKHSFVIQQLKNHYESLMTLFDVIIVGAGPAGSLLAYYLAIHNINALIIDKKKLPRNKICGGGLTRRSMNTLPFDVSEVIESYTRSVSISVHNRIFFHHTSTFPIMGMVMRDKFDCFLLKKAMDRGATLMDETAFRSMTPESGLLNVKASKGIFKSKILVGADGVHSRVAKALELNTTHRRMVGLESEIYVDRKNIFHIFVNSAEFDFGIIPEGYGWIFPKKDHLSIGVVTLKKNIDGMKQHLYRYLESKKLLDNSTIMSSKGWMIPYGTSTEMLLANEKGLLVGDAAGLTDPITGEGIFFALKEAEIASQIILGNMVKGESLYKYNAAIGSLRNDLAYALKLQKLLYKIPQISYKLLKIYGAQLGKEFMDIINGDTTYCTLYKKLFRLRAIWSLLLSIRKK